jgi:hypothetical protein
MNEIGRKILKYILALLTVSGFFLLGWGLVYIIGIIIMTFLGVR